MHVCVSVCDCILISLDNEPLSWNDFVLLNKQDKLIHSHYLIISRYVICV